MKPPKKLYKTDVLIMYASILGLNGRNSKVFLKFLPENYEGRCFSED